MGLLYSKIFHKKIDEDIQLKIDVEHNKTIRYRNYIFDNMNHHDYNTYLRLLREKNLKDDNIYITKSQII